MMTSPNLLRIQRILDEFTPDNFYLIRAQLADSPVTTTDILKGLISMIYEKALEEPAFCPMYAQLFSLLHSDLEQKLPAFPFEEAADANEQIFKRHLLNKCEETFEIRQISSSSDQESKCRDQERLMKLHILCNIRLIGELFKCSMVPELLVHHIAKELLGLNNTMTFPEELDVEAACLLFRTIGKNLDETRMLRSLGNLDGMLRSLGNLDGYDDYDVYYVRLKELSWYPMLLLKPIIQELLDLRANKWVAKGGKGRKLRASVLRCYCGTVAQLETTESPHNGERRFLTCSNTSPIMNRCGFFVWEDMYLWIRKRSEVRAGGKTKKLLSFLLIAVAVIWFIFLKNNEQVDGSCKCL